MLFLVCLCLYHSISNRFNDTDMLILYFVYTLLPSFVFFYYSKIMNESDDDDKKTNILYDLSLSNWEYAQAIFDFRKSKACLLWPIMFAEYYLL